MVEMAQQFGTTVIDRSVPGWPALACALLLGGSPQSKSIVAEMSPRKQRLIVPKDR